MDSMHVVLVIGIPSVSLQPPLTDGSMGSLIVHAGKGKSRVHTSVYSARPSHRATMAPSTRKKDTML